MYFFLEEEKDNRRISRGVVVSLLFPHGLEDSGHLLTLPLGPDVGADSLLQELEATLVLGDLEQLHGPSLVGSEADNLTDEVAASLVMLGHASFGPGRGQRGLDLGGLLALLHANDHFVTGCHLDCWVVCACPLLLDSRVGERKKKPH